MITAITIAGNEPEWIQKLPFGGVPKAIDGNPAARDLTAITDDSCILAVERKTATDFLNTLKEDRLFPQLARLAEMRIAQQRVDEKLTYLPYLIITGSFLPGSNGKVVADGRETGWGFEKVQGTLLSIQEMGVFVVFANGDLDYENTILRIGRRNRETPMKILASRPAKMLGPKFDFLAGIDGIEVGYAEKILAWSSDNVAHALSGLTDLEVKAPVPINVRKRFRDMLGLCEGENLEIVGTQASAPVRADLKHLVKEK
jgi:hypothetical protein